MAEIMSGKGITKKIGNKVILSEVDLAIEEGEVVALLGPSGSGKSTLLRCLNGLETIASGELFFDGNKIERSEKNWQQLRQEIGMVFQSYDLFPNKTVLENLLLGPVKVQKREPKEVEREALDWLARVGLKERAQDYPRQLSGGQKQRVAIIRSLCMKPRLMLFDEVTASLDPEMVREVLEVILELAKTDKTLLIVTHEMSFAQQVSDRVLFMAEGKIIENSATPAFFSGPQTKRARDFLQSLDYTNL
ncbi:amino acid ABC transporter ATP-binding protein [Candidatus Enterococcus leclercqii]|uniref:amino acid ABC transporter ATP-binding protein n=1 Tax=Enterococcus TaxID=1350 RepID=UPI001379CD03|nr:amino acid ABC transporter ATP-binding protein [Enterococcus sp. CU9D]KAF1291337.1 glutamine ABC transporter ATP-binding protein [Enterococcus sp. CU9D]